jgi:hypothetical protein
MRKWAALDEPDGRSGEFTKLPSGVKSVYSYVSLVAFAPTFQIHSFFY